MPIAPTLAQLKAMSMDELIATHDAAAQSTQVGTQAYLDEIRYREQALLAKRMEEFTRRIHILTWLIAFMTAISTGSVIYGSVADRSEGGPAPYAAAGAVSESE